jgi:hypothetical protein
MTSNFSKGSKFKPMNPPTMAIKKDARTIISNDEGGVEKNNVPNKNKNKLLSTLEKPLELIKIPNPTLITTTLQNTHEIPQNVINNTFYEKYIHNAMVNIRKGSEKYFENLGVKYNIQSSTNPHNELAQERAYLENLARKYLQYSPITGLFRRKMADIGGSCRGTTYGLTLKTGNEFINRPILPDQPQDISRYNNLQAAMVLGSDHYNWCSCLQNDICTHIREFNPDDLLMTHTAYYLDLEKIISSFLDKDHIIHLVLHIFNPNRNKSSLSIGGLEQCQWEINEKNGMREVTFTARGNADYKHNTILSGLYEKDNVKLAEGIFANTIYSFQHENDKHAYVQIVSTNQTRNPNFKFQFKDVYENHSVNRKVRLCKESFVANGMYKILSTMEEAPEGELRLIQCCDVNANKNEYVIMKRIGTTLQSIKFYRDAHLTDIFKTFTLTMEMEQSSFCITTEVYNQVLRKIVAANVIDTNTITSYFTDYWRRTSQTADFNLATPFIVDVMHTALEHHLRITQVSNSLLVQALNEAKQGKFTENPGIFKSLYLDALAQDLNPRSGELFDTHVNDIFINKKTTIKNSKEKRNPPQESSKSYADYEETREFSSTFNNNNKEKNSLNLHFNKPYLHSFHGYEEAFYSLDSEFFVPLTASHEYDYLSVNNTDSMQFDSEYSSENGELSTAIIDHTKKNKLDDNLMVPQEVLDQQAKNDFKEMEKNRENWQPQNNTKFSLGFCGVNDGNISMKKEKEITSITTNKLKQDEVFHKTTCVPKELYDKFLIKQIDHPKDTVNTQIQDTSYEALKKRCKHQDNKGTMLKFPLMTDDRLNFISYHNCDLNLFVAASRTLMPGPVPSLPMIEKYIVFIEKNFFPKIEEILRDFKYDANAWFNTLNAKQQREVKIYFTDVEKRKEITCEPVDSFVKNEAQKPGDKARMIGGPKASTKFTLGPVINALAHYLKKINGWGVGKNYEEKAQFFMQCEEKGYLKSVTTDVSGLDQSHNPILKTFWSKILNLIIDKIDHVPRETFIQHFNPQITVCNYTTNKLEKSAQLCTTRTKHKLASGKPYTTILNTTMILSILEFTHEIGKLGPLVCSTSGDDSVAFYPDYIQDATIVDAYSRVFNSDSNRGVPNGLGLVLKYMRIGRLTDATPCSTAAFKCYDHYKIVRPLDRVLLQLPAAKNMEGLSAEQQKIYKTVVALGEEQWGAGLPIIDTIIKKLKCDPSITLDNLPSKQGDVREKIPCNEEIFNEVYNNVNTSDKAIRILEYIGKDQFHSFMTKQDKICKYCPDNYKIHLEKVYDLQEDDIIELENNISKCTYNSRLDSFIPSKIYENGSKYYEKLNVPMQFDAKKQMIDYYKCYAEEISKTVRTSLKYAHNKTHFLVKFGEKGVVGVIGLLAALAGKVYHRDPILKMIELGLNTLPVSYEDEIYQGTIKDVPVAKILAWLEECNGSPLFIKEANALLCNIEDNSDLNLEIEIQPDGKHSREEIIERQLQEENYDPRIENLDRIPRKLLKNRNYVYIGRNQKNSHDVRYGNPFGVGEYGREGAIAKYREWLYSKECTLTTDDIWFLQDKTLICHCKPKKCHGEVLLEYLDDLIAHYDR